MNSWATFTPQGRSVRSRILAISTRTSSSWPDDVSMIPIPPAFETADASCARAMKPIGAWMIGISMPSCSVTRVCTVPPSTGRSGASYAAAPSTSLDTRRGDPSVCGRCRGCSIVHHTPSPSVHSMLEAVKVGRDRRRDRGRRGGRAGRARRATATDVLAADAYLLGTPANLGYISGALKHFFDQIYYPCLEETVGRPFGVYLHGNNDTDRRRAGDRGRSPPGCAGTSRPSRSRVIGAPTRADLDACWDLGATLAAGLTL